MTSFEEFCKKYQRRKKLLLPMGLRWDGYTTQRHLVIAKIGHSGSEFDKIDALVSEIQQCCVQEY
jgi:hypothetical protein